MNPAWQNLLQENGARIADEDVTDFGNPPVELLAARDGTVVVPLAHLGLIRATGEDAAEFLHNLTSNDVKKLGVQSAQYSSFNTAKGRMLASFLLWREDGDYLVQLSRDIQPAIQKKLSMYVLRSKVKLSDATDSRLVVGVAGPDAAALVKGLGASLPEASMGVLPFPGGIVIRLGDTRFLLALEADKAASAWTQLAAKAVPAGTPVWRWLDIRAGIPRISQATQEEFVPQMTNLDLVGGVSFTKGCYPGQEIVARTRYLGKIKRRMFLGHAEATPTIGAHVYAPETGEQACGMVVDAVPAPGGGVDVLAVMQISCAEAGDIRLATPDGARLSLLSLPYALESAN